MKSDGLFKHIALAFGIAVLLYAVTYTGIEHRRTRRGPWQVTFTNDPAGAPAVLINQPALAITNVQIVFPGELPGTNATWVFTQPRAVPFPIPLGRCLFMDMTSLPGTVVFELYGHEIQLIPRVLTIDKKELPWRSDTMIALPDTNLLQSTTTPTTSRNIK